MDEPPVLNGRVSSRELYTAISSLRDELGAAQQAQTADVVAAVAATARVGLGGHAPLRNGRDDPIRVVPDRGQTR